MNNIIKSGIAMFLAAFLLLGCEPEEFDKSSLGIEGAPTDEQMDFTVTPGDDAFHFNLQNNTPVTGVATIEWDLGNGTVLKGNKVEAYYPIAGEYVLTLTITANNGESNSKTHEINQNETDYAFLESPLLTAISGGADATEGKTWVIDSLSQAHLGVGPSSSYSPSDWAATPLAKSGHYIYDDEFTFKLVGFDYTIDTHGATHANSDGGAVDVGLDVGYYTSVLWEDQYDKDVTTDDAARGDLKWSLIEKDDKHFITLSSQNGVVGYDGGHERSYEILEWSENFLHLRSVGGNARYHKLIPKGYEKPVVTFETVIAETAEENEWSVNLANVNIPEGINVNGYTVDFGDGTDVYTTEDYTATISHVYMRKGTFPVTITVLASNENVVDNQSIMVENYHSEYEPFLLDQMVMYVDNSEVQMAPVLGQDCDVTVVDNPERIYPNKGVKVFHYRKENQQWANAYMELPAGYRFNLTNSSVFRIMVRGKAGQEILMKLENTDKGGNAWQTGTYDLIYTIQEDDTWEVAEFDFAGVGAGFDWTGDQFTSDVTTDPNFNQGFYNVIRIMCNPGVGEGVHEFYFDDLEGPHVEGLKSAN